MKLLSGHEVDFDDISKLAVSYNDIETSLSRINRFNGHTPTGMIWSVAAHSVLVSMLCPTIETKVWGLLHDAEEAYTCDLPKVLKNWVNDNSEGAYSRLQHSVSNEIIDTLVKDIRISDSDKQLVKLMDDLVNDVEYRYFMGEGVVENNFTLKDFFIKFDKTESYHCSEARTRFRNLATLYKLI